MPFLYTTQIANRRLLFLRSLDLQSQIKNTTSLYKVKVYSVHWREMSASPSDHLSQHCGVTWKMFVCSVNMYVVLELGKRKWSKECFHTFFIIKPNTFVFNILLTKLFTVNIHWNYPNLKPRVGKTTSEFHDQLNLSF